MTLTEFLLARIAEDEANDLLFAHTIACGSNRHPDPNSWDAGPCDCGADDRRAAEVATKRRIVEECDSTRANDLGPAANILASLTLEALAALYADHPDYDEAWA